MSNEWQSFEERVQKMVEGLRQVVPASAEKVFLFGKELATAEIHQRLEAISRRHAAVRQAKAGHEQAVRARRQAAQEDRAFFHQVELYLRNRFGSDAADLAPFGLAPPKKPRPLSAAAKVIAKAKAAETRRRRREQTVVVTASSPAGPRCPLAKP